MRKKILQKTIALICSYTFCLGLAAAQPHCQLNAFASNPVIVEDSEQAEGKRENCKENEEVVNVNGKITCQEDEKEETVSWASWLIQSHKMPNLHFIDLLELFSN